MSPKIDLSVPNPTQETPHLNWGKLPMTYQPTSPSPTSPCASADVKVGDRAPSGLKKPNASGAESSAPLNWCDAESDDTPGSAEAQKETDSGKIGRPGVCVFLLIKPLTPIL